MSNGPRNPVLTNPDMLRFRPVETHFLRSEDAKQTFCIQVAQPFLRKDDTRRLPVVYVTDGNWVFDMFKSLSCLLQMAAADSPPFILVGIGYPGDSPHAGALLRAREFTYPPYMSIDTKPLREMLASAPDVSLFEGTLLPEDGAKDFHGAPEFLKFIADDLIPFIDARYPTAKDERIYFGHSGGGYFGLYTMFTRPSAFKNYIVSSPGLLYHGTAPDGQQYNWYDCGLQMARAFLDTGQSLEGISLYMSAGAEEEYEPALGAWQMVSGFYQMAKYLKNAKIPGLDLMTEVFPAETHITVWPIAFIHGVQAMLGTRRVVRSVYF